MSPTLKVMERTTDKTKTRSPQNSSTRYIPIPKDKRIEVVWFFWTGPIVNL
jgi:hypothetical protein